MEANPKIGSKIATKFQSHILNDGNYISKHWTPFVKFLKFFQAFLGKLIENFRYAMKIEFPVLCRQIVEFDK